MFILALFLLVIIAAYLIMRSEKNKMVMSKVPSGTLFFYSMEGCPHCDTMQSVLDLLNPSIRVFKITLKSDLTLDYSDDSEEYKRLSKENVPDGYPMLVIGDTKHTGTMTEAELKKFLNISL